MKKIGRLKNQTKKWNYGVSIHRSFVFFDPPIVISIWLFKLKEEAQDGESIRGMKKLGFWKEFYFKWPNKHV